MSKRSGGDGNDLFSAEGETDLAFSTEKHVQISPLTLIFSDRDEETEFRSKLHAKSKRLTRISLVIIILGLLATFVLDRIFDEDSALGYNQEQLKNRDIVRFIMIPIVVTWLYLTHLEKYSDYFITVTYTCTLTLGILIVVMSILGQKPDHGPHMLYLFFAWLFVRLPFFASMFVGWPIFCTYSLGIPIFVDDYDNKSSSGSFTVSVIYLLVTNVSLNLAAFFIERLDRREFLHSKSIDRENQVNKDLLANLLPPSVTMKLEKNVTGQGAAEPIATLESDVSILFSDLVGFTRYASTITARSLVNFLNDLYHNFDRLCDAVEAYKVETIGDAYFVSAGCPEPNEQHAHCLVRLGLMMIAECQRIVLENGNHPNIRVGVHSGSVMAGVVGKKMPRYHLFGRTVSIAERMESSGKPGKVQVSETTHRLITDSYICEPYQAAHNDQGPTFLVKSKIMGDGSVCDVVDLEYDQPHE